MSAELGGFTSPTIVIALILLILVVPAASGSSSTISQFEVDGVRRINTFRTSHGLRPVYIDGRLSRAGGWMALDMPTNDYFGHVDSRGRDPFQRLGAFGYPSNTWRGENLAAGHAGSLATFQQWLASPPHRAIMLTPQYRAVGISRVNSPGSDYRYYWAADFGSRWIGPAD